MRNIVLAAGAVLLIAYLLLPRPLAPNPALPTFDDVREKTGASLSYGREMPFPHRRARVYGCIYPPLVPTAQLILLSVQRGRGVSTAAIGSQDKETTTAEIVIAPGEQPLYLVALSGRPVIWRVSGAVARVRHMVLAGTARMPGDARHDLPLVGASGLAREQVAILPHADCLDPFTATGNSGAVQTAGIVREHLGRMPDLVAAAESVSRVLVPSGQIENTNPFSVWRRIREQPLLSLIGLARPSPFRAELRRAFIASYPDGVVPVDPDAVIASAPVTPYTVLPGYAGLQQLVREGALEDLGTGEFRLHRATRLPPDLTWTTFLLPKGVPKPDGPPGLACVISEETGKPVPGLSDNSSFC